MPAGLSLPQYLPRLQEHGITDLAQLLSIPDAEIDSQLATFGLLKGHAIKLKLSLGALRGSAKSVGYASTYAPTPVYQLPAYAPLSQPVTLPKPAPPVAKEVEKVTPRGKDIDVVKGAIMQAKLVIMGLDVVAYKKTLDMIGELQTVLRGVKEQMGETEKDQDEPMEQEKKGEEVVLSDYTTANCASSLNSILTHAALSTTAIKTTVVSMLVSSTYMEAGLSYSSFYPVFQAQYPALPDLAQITAAALVLSATFVPWTRQRVVRPVLGLLWLGVALLYYWETVGGWVGVGMAGLCLGEAILLLVNIEAWWISRKLSLQVDYFPIVVDLKTLNSAIGCFGAFTLLVLPI